VLRQRRASPVRASFSSRVPSQTSLEKKRFPALPFVLILAPFGALTFPSYDPPTVQQRSALRLESVCEWSPPPKQPPVCGFVPCADDSPPCAAHLLHSCLWPPPCRHHASAEPVAGSLMYWQTTSSPVLCSFQATKTPIGLHFLPDLGSRPASRGCTNGASLSAVIFHFLSHLLLHGREWKLSYRRGIAPLDWSPNSAPVAAASAVFLILPLVRVLLLDGMPLGISGTQLHVGVPSRAQHPDAPLPHAWVVLVSRRLPCSRHAPFPLVHQLLGA